MGPYESEIARWHKLRKEHPEDEVSDTAISEMVLEDDWPAKLRKAHFEKIESFISDSRFA
jgi:hypothetical protein